MNDTVPGADKEQCDLLDNLRRGRPAAGQDPVKRGQIIEGARRIFIEKGFEAASMNDITREAGVSKGTIYVYFANKEELFEALIEEERGTTFIVGNGCTSELVGTIAMGGVFLAGIGSVLKELNRTVRFEIDIAHETLHIKWDRTDRFE